MNVVVKALKPFFQWLAATDFFMKVGPKIVPPMDRAVYRLTRGKMVTSDQMIPTLILTTTGSKSGEPRTAPLACLPEEAGSFLVVGSNFGRSFHPAWSGNLMKTPAAQVSFRGATFPVVAELLSGEARVQAWVGLIELWPTYDRYTEKSGRDLRVFRLTRA